MRTWAVGIVALLAAGCGLEARSPEWSDRDLDSDGDGPALGSPPVRRIVAGSGSRYSPLISMSTMRSIASFRRVTK